MTQRYGLKGNQTGVRRCEAAGVEIERAQVILEADVEPLAAGSARLGDGDRHELGPYALPAGVRGHHSVEDEGMDCTVPRHVDKTHELVAVTGTDPAQAVPLNLALPVVFKYSMDECHRM